jgi:hypothetical protein
MTALKLERVKNFRLGISELAEIDAAGMLEKAVISIK